MTTFLPLSYCQSC